MKVALVVLVVLATGCATAPQERSVFPKVRAVSVAVVTNEGHGSGTLVSNRCALTAQHVIDGEDANSIVVQTPDGKDHPVVVEKEDEAEDLALVCATNPFATQAVQIGSTPAIDDPVIVVGNPVMYHRVLTEGRYEDVDMITAQCAPGNSGGGVFDQNGRLVGVVDNIVVMRKAEVPMTFAHLCGIVGVTSIKNFLNGVKL